MAEEFADAAASKFMAHSNESRTAQDADVSAMNNVAAECTINDGGFFWKVGRRRDSFSVQEETSTAFSAHEHPAQAKVANGQNEFLASNDKHCLLDNFTATGCRHTTPKYLAQVA